MDRYVDSTQQLVTEVMVNDVSRSVDFYRRLGFELTRETGDFVELAWEGHLVFLAEQSAFPAGEGTTWPGHSTFPVANVRVMVPDVDRYWRLANDLAVEIIIPIGDRYYGLRDFTIRDPDGFGVRFATFLPGSADR